MARLREPKRLANTALTTQVVNGNVDFKKSAADTEAADVPARLRECIVEDWLEPGDEVALRKELQYVMAHRDPEEYVRTGLMLTAWRRHALARFAWFAERGIPRDQHSRLIPARGRPRWANLPRKADDTDGGLTQPPGLSREDRREDQG